MVIFLYGPDSCRRNKKLRELTTAYLSKYKVGDVMFVDLQEMPEDWPKVKDFLEQRSMFAESKLAIIKGATLVEKKSWIDLIKEQINAKKVFIIISEAKKATGKFSFLLNQAVKSLEFKELTGKKLQVFLERELRIRDLGLKTEIKDFLLKYAESIKSEKSWVLVNELDKLRLFLSSQPTRLDLVSAVLNTSEKYDFFLIIKNIFNQKTYPAKLFFLENLLIKNEPAGRIFNSLVFFAKGRNIIKLAEYDVAIKSGKLDYETALVDFLIG